MPNDNRRRPRIVLFLSVLILSSATSFAHPMGNFSVNHYSKITIGQQSIEIRYLIDMAEIPTFQEIRQFGLSPKADDLGTSLYLDKQQQLLKAGLSLESGGQAVRLDTISHEVAFAHGAGGLRDKPALPNGSRVVGHIQEIGRLIIADVARVLA